MYNAREQQIAFFRLFIIDMKYIIFYFEKTGHKWTLYINLYNIYLFLCSGI